MDFHFENNSIKIIHQNKTFHLHPIWLRERLPGEKYFDLDTNLRLYLYLEIGNVNLFWLMTQMLLAHLI